MTRTWIALLGGVWLLLSGTGLDAQTVRVKFRYLPQGVYSRVHFPGEFNNWGNNSAGTISATDVGSLADSLETKTGMYVKTVYLQFRRYQYKIYRQINESPPTNWSWISDPLNRNINPLDNNNSFFFVDSLTLLELCAYPYIIEPSGTGTKFVVKSGYPNISAGIFQPSGAPSAQLSAMVDGTPIVNPLSYADTSTGIFTYKPSAPVPDGIHNFVLTATAGGISKTDSVSFEIRARPVQIQTPPFTTVKTTYITAGILLKPDGSGPDSSITSLTMNVNGATKSIAAANGSFLDTTAIREGRNAILVSSSTGKDSVIVVRLVNHAPNGQVAVTSGPGTLTFDASHSTDPDTGHTLTFQWTDDPVRPLGLAGKTGAMPSVPRPTTPGDYFFGLITTDNVGNADTLRSFITVQRDSSIVAADYSAVPQWVKQGRMYSVFFKGLNSQGTINAAVPYLRYIKNMGFNIIWVLPVMQNASLMDNGSGIGYNIKDFTTVAPEYGTNADFQNFVQQAHLLGLKVILDVTPNHTSYTHPFVTEGRVLKQKSPHWSYYQHQPLGASNVGAQNQDPDGFIYYSGFSSQLLNYNWADLDARTYMTGVYSWWMKNMGIDGYRFDVYWGPHNRTNFGYGGESEMGVPVRLALKHFKPDSYLLGETAGTGAGTEVNYADRGGGVDGAYDWNLKGVVQGFNFTSAAVENLHGAVYNNNFYPGPNSTFLRFLENQDEDRISYIYGSFEKTKPVAAVIFTAPGMPLIWQGEEVGIGLGDPNYDHRRRGVVDWNFSGKAVLQPFYQRLAQIRAQFPAFSTQQMTRLTSGNGLVYAFIRPYAREEGIVLVNFGATSTQVTLGFAATNFALPPRDLKMYTMSDLTHDSTSTIQFAAGAAQFNCTLEPYGSSIFVLADSVRRLVLPSITNVVTDKPGGDIPTAYQLLQNFPNPFNPTTTIPFTVPTESSVSLRIYNLLGAEVAVLVDGRMAPGNHTAIWDGRTGNGRYASSGVYFVRMVSGSYSATRKLILLK